MSTTLFISYNPNSEIEQSIALRLQTLASLQNVSVLLPDRHGATRLKESTKARIKEASAFVVFSTASLSKTVKEEIEYARSLRKNVVVVYDVKKNVSSRLEGVTEVSANFERESPDAILKKILERVAFKSDNQNAFAALILFGLGMLLLWAMSDDKK